jgi:hypothetical protein
MVVELNLSAPLAMITTSRGHEIVLAKSACSVVQNIMALKAVVIITSRGKVPGVEDPISYLLT